MTAYKSPLTLVPLSRDEIDALAKLHTSRVLAWYVGLTTRNNGRGMGLRSLVESIDMADELRAKALREEP